VDPYQPAEEEQPHMPAILEALLERPPALVAIQTRGPAILRDLALIQQLASSTKIRVSFSITTDRDDVRRLYEPHCVPNEERLAVICELRRAGVETYATLAPLLPCDPEALAHAALDASGRDLIGDPLHIRATKRTGATTRAEAFRIAQHHGHLQWFDASFQAKIVERISAVAAARGSQFGTGPEGFSWLAQM
jgi:DNA repair photolyase